MQGMGVALICCSHRGPISRLINTQTAASWDLKKKTKVPLQFWGKNNEKKCYVGQRGQSSPNTRTAKLLQDICINLQTSNIHRTKNREKLVSKTGCQ